MCGGNSVKYLLKLSQLLKIILLLFISYFSLLCHSVLISVNMALSNKQCGVKKSFLCF